MLEEGTSLAVQWLRLCAPNAGGMGSIPGRGTGELRSCMLHGTAKKKNKKQLEETEWKMQLQN